VITPPKKLSLAVKQTLKGSGGE